MLRLVKILDFREINNEDGEGLNNKICELDEVKSSKEIKKIELYYQAMLKLKSNRCCLI
ncbi:hypothetical protein ACE4V3_06230 (plasmid) [Borrelia recurrentis]|uniref:hypothetical protein n=1 Tax=Borrelia recurrentis TaxID=44449 RepID=UPI000322236B|nr:hypothetical protein [Borrelia recurrentis]